MRMVAVSCYHCIFRAKHSHCSGNYCLLPDIKMAEATDFLHAVKLSCPFFKLPHQQHVFIPLEPGVFTEYFFSHKKCEGQRYRNRKTLHVISYVLDENPF